MVQETRSLVFEDEEVFEAVSELVSARAESLPETGRATLRPHENDYGHLAVDVVFVDDKGAPIHTVSLSEEELSEALVAYCSRLKIPMPRSVEKRAEWRGDSMALIFRM